MVNPPAWTLFCAKRYCQWLWDELSSSDSSHATLSPWGWILLSSPPLAIHVCGNGCASQVESLVLAHLNSLESSLVIDEWPSMMAQSGVIVSVRPCIESDYYWASLAWQNALGRDECAIELGRDTIILEMQSLYCSMQSLYTLDNRTAVIIIMLSEQDVKRWFGGSRRHHPEHSYSRIWRIWAECKSGTHSSYIFHRYPLS